MEAVRRQSLSGSKAREELQSAQAVIQTMVAEVVEIEKKARYSQQMVDDMCRDIRKLDTAKKNLTHTITALRRLSMLIDAVEQLQESAEKHKYKESSQLLGAVQQISAHFTKYNHIPRVAELKGRIYALEKSLRTAALREFELIGEDIPSSRVLERLKDCCLVMAALGTSAQNELMDTLCRREMGMYTQIFGTIGETAKLERTVNRYKWFIRRLDGRKDIWNIFPEDWRITQLLAATFCSITKSELAEILDTKSPHLRNDVDGFLKAVEATLVFEQEMSRRFHVDDAVSEEDEPGEEDEDRDNAFLYHQSHSKHKSNTTADEIRKKYLKERKDSEEKRARQADAAAAAVSRATFKNAISPVFLPYMYIYTEDAENILRSKMQESIQAETWTAMSVDQNILKSSDLLTSSVREEMQHCASKVSKGQGLHSLSNIFGKTYEAYASALLNKIPKTSAGSTIGTPVLGVTSWHVKLGPRDIELICLIISTSEHCISMLGQLERALESRLDADFKGRVDMSGAEDAFNSLITQSLSSLLLGVETHLEIPLATLMRKSWHAVDVTGDQSEYMRDMCSIFRDVGSKIKPPHLSAMHFSFFCDKLIRSFCPRLLDAIFRCGSISQAGGQQLRLDIEALRSSLFDLGKQGDTLLGSSSPRRMAQPESPLSDESPSENMKSWSQTFSEDVAALLGRIEVVLKVVTSPPDAIVDTFMELLPSGNSKDLHQIIELMGLKRSDSAAILEEFKHKGGLLVPMSDSYKDSSNSSGLSPGKAIFSTGNRSSSFILPPGAAAKASAAAQDMASRLRLNANVQAARLSAAAASGSMRQTMGRTLGAVKSFMNQRE